jgi:hypothetical protein
MKVFKYQFEIRYTPFLNFSSAYKSFMGRYMRSGEIFIQNENTHQEQIVLRYPVERYQFDCRWDRLVFISEGQRQDLDRPQGPLFNFFEIMNNLRESNGFGVVTNALISGAFLQEIEDTNDNIIQRFKSKFITGPDFNFPSYTEDYSVIQEFAKEDKLFRIKYGPFNHKSDVKNHLLSPVLQLSRENFKEFTGIFIDALYFEKGPAFDFNSFLAMDKKIRGNISKINLNV